MKKVVIFYPYATGEKAFSGGVPKVIVSNIIAVNKNGDKPYVILPVGNSGLINYIRENCPYCEIVPIEFQTLALYSDVKNVFTRAKLVTKHLIGVFRGRKLLKEALEKIQPDVIHYHEINCYNILGLYRKAKVVFHVHSYRFTSYKVVAPRIYKACNKYADVIISPTESIKAAMQPHLTKEVTIVNTPYLDLSGGKKTFDNPVSNKLAEIKKEKILFSFVGRICTIKRIDHFVKAIALLPKELTKKMQFVIVGGCNTKGDKDYKNMVIDTARKNGVEDVLNFVGYVNPVEAALSVIDYGVMLTESEAMPMVGIEYMKFNIPIIAYAAPGIADFMVNDENGFLIENGNINEIAKVLERILNKVDIPDFDTTIPPHFNGYSIEAFAEILKKIY